MSRRFAIAVLAGVSLAYALVASAAAHDIYTGIKGKNGQLCCGADDCAATIYRERGARFEFLTRENHWIAIPQERITFLPIPGDRPDDGESRRAHLCYQVPTSEYTPGYVNEDSANFFVSVDGAERIDLYCAFIPPGGA